MFFIFQKSRKLSHCARDMVILQLDLHIWSRIMRSTTQMFISSFYNTTEIILDKCSVIKLQGSYLCLTFKTIYLVKKANVLAIFIRCKTNYV